VPALGALARGWRQDLAAFVIGVTGSVGKTSTKDLIAAMIAPHRSIAASRENYNTEIGLPLEILAAPWGTEVLVLEMAMRGFGQIRELAAIAEPDVGVITNIGPVHLEQMGSLEGVAEAKAELLDGLQPGGTAVVPSDEPLLEPWLRDDLEIVTFGPAGRRALRGRLDQVRRRARRGADQPRRDRRGERDRARACRSTQSTTCSTARRGAPPRGRSGSRRAG
jgi:UDP-N-acetylmuramoyl-tripeptide--D-alanyl-D-alanine ligase